jgi:TPR repeat protein
MRFFQGLGIERNLRAAQIFLERACAEGAGESCHVLGRMGEEKLGGIASDDRTRRLFWRACVVGYRRDCLREEVAVRSATGPHEERLGSRAPERIAEAARRCDGGLPAACWMLSRAYETGRGVPRDPVAAESLRRTACEWGVLSACYGAVSPVGAPVEAVPP